MALFTGFSLRGKRGLMIAALAIAVTVCTADTFF